MMMIDDVVLFEVLDDACDGHQSDGGFEFDD